VTIWYWSASESSGKNRPDANEEAKRMTASPRRAIESQFKPFLSTGDIMRSIGISTIVLILSGIVGSPGRNESVAAQKDGAKSADKLDGKWYCVKQEQFGGPVPAIVARRLHIVIDGINMEWYIGNPAPNQTAVITFDSEKKTIDAKVTRGSLNGKTMVGIYKLENGMLHVCWAEIEAKRPEKFVTTKPGGGAFEYSVYSREKPKADAPPTPKPINVPPKVDAPPTLNPVNVPSGKTRPLSDMKFTLPKGWEAKFSDNLKTWAISQGFTPTVDVCWALAKDYPRDLDDYVDRLQKTGDHFAYGLYFDSVTEKGKLADGLYVVGKVKLKTDKEAKRIGFSIIRDIGGERVIFESFSTYYDDAKLLKEAMEIAKGAKY
jgi:uncharacterized protein (TIGR03067 family)